MVVKPSDEKQIFVSLVNIWDDTVRIKTTKYSLIMLNIWGSVWLRLFRASPYFELNERLDPSSLLRPSI